MDPGEAPEVIDLDQPAADPILGVEVSGLTRAFGPVQAVRGIDMRARYGEVTALVGPNGAGKTTLLLVLATLLTPDTGMVRVAGHDPVTDPRAVRAAMGWSPDVFGLPENLTAQEYLVSAAAAHRLPKPGRAPHALNLLRTVGLAEFAGQPARVLSRGQKQRLGLARALVHGPKVLLLDEPAAGLDPRARVALRDLLRGLAAQGAAVIVSSHILADLEDLADSAVIVDRGITVATHRLDALPASVTPRPWRIRALDGDPLLAALEQRRIPCAVIGSGQVELLLRDDTEAADLLAVLVGDGVRVVACAPTGGSLEAAYLEATELPLGVTS